MADDLRVNSWLVIPAGELRERFSRSSGPGGQSVNTTDSRVELSFDVLRSPSLPERERERALARLDTRLADGVITVAAEGERSQLMNRDAARARLAALGCDDDAGLCAAIRDGSLDHRFGEVVEAVRAATIDKLIVANPGHLSLPG